MARDTSILSGKYAWIWTVQGCFGGDVGQIVANAKALDLRGLIIKAGDGANVWSQFAGIVQAVKNAGLVAGAWTYCYGDNPDAEASVASQAIQSGADFLALDVEMEYAGKSASAVMMGQLLRALHPDTVIAFAPYCYPHNPQFAGYNWSPKWGQVPYNEFMSFCDAVMPQVYWSDWPPKVDVGLKAMDRMMRPWGKPIFPIGQTYADNYTPTSEDYTLFEDTCHALGYEGVSFWRLGTTTQAMQDAVTRMKFSVVQPAPAVPTTLATPPTQPSFSDVSSWALASVQKAIKVGVMTCDAQGFHPRDAVTREQLAVVLDRAGILDEVQKVKGLS